jgi:hypothetical protein
MDDFPLIMLGIAVLLFISLLVLLLPHSAIHPLGINVTHNPDGSCQFTWLGGTDYQSFVRDISVDNISIGHPAPGTIIHEGDCNSTVKMYFNDVNAYRELWPNAEAKDVNV